MRDGKVRLGKESLFAQTKLDEKIGEDVDMNDVGDDHDIYIVKETGKMFIKDFEQEDNDKNEK